MIYSGWKRNLIAEGVEPNPGPFEFLELEYVLQKTFGSRLDTNILAVVKKLHNASRGKISKLHIPDQAIRILSSQEKALDIVSEKLPVETDEDITNQREVLSELRTYLLKVISEQEWDTSNVNVTSSLLLI